MLGVLQNRDGFLEGAIVQIGLHCGDSRLAGFEEAAGKFRALHLRRMVADHRLQSLMVATRGRAAGVGVAKHGLQIRVAGEAEVLGETHDRRRLHAARIGDVAYANDDHLLAMLGDVLRDELELLGEVVILAGDPLNQILNSVVLSHVG